jgi:hypothetical protein
MDDPQRCRAVGRGIWCKFALAGAALGMALGAQVTYVPRLGLWGFDVSSVFGMLEFAILGGLLGTIVGLVRAGIGTMMRRGRIK